MRNAVRVVSLLLALGGVAACGSKAPPPPAAAIAAEPHWQDVFDTTPELLVVVRPKALTGDRIYGALLRRAIATAREKSSVVAATRFADAVEDADEVVVGFRPDTPDHAGEIVLIARGVRADVDPAKLVDSEGHGLWTPGPSGAARELVCEQDAHGHPLGASLFELPGRTWVIATGAARQRARDAFAHPFARPPMDLDPSALAIVRIDGPSLVARVAFLQEYGSFAAAGRHLKSVTFSLPPGGEGSVKGTLAYADEDAAALAEVSIREHVDAVARLQKPESLTWLGSAKVERPDTRVVMTAPLPPKIVDALLSAGGTSLPAVQGSGLPAR
jgi:hypothetical protein